MARTPSRTCAVVLWMATVVATVFLVAGCTSTTTTEISNPPIPTVSETSVPTKSKSDPDKALEGHIQLALNYIGTDQRDQARFHIDKAMALNSRSPGIYNAQALLYQVEKEDKLAEENFRKALSYDSNFTRARYNFGSFLYSRGRFEEAYEQFTRAGQDLDYNLRGQVFYRIGVTAAKLGKPQEAEQAWGKAINLMPTLPGPYLELAELYFQRRELPQTKAALERYQDLAKPSARSLWLGARLEHALGNEDGVASRTLALQKLFPQSREVVAYQEWVKNGRP